MMSNSVNSNAALAAAGTIGSLLRGNDLPHLERTLLLAHVLNASRESVLAYPERSVSVDSAIKYAGFIARRLAGEPIAYLVGSREFYGLALHVTPQVLIPRPDTELLVDAALVKLPLVSPGRALDLGTGSGAVAIALARSRPNIQFDAIDLADGAVELAAANAIALSIANVSFYRSNWYSACDDRIYDVIVSNPPYISTADPHLLEGDLRYEPGLALISGADGLAAIREIVAGAGIRLAPGGWLLFEHGYDQAQRCRELMAGAGFDKISTLRDLAGAERVCEGRKRDDSTSVYATIGRPG